MHHLNILALPRQNVQSDIYSCGKLLQVLLTGRLDGMVKGRFEKVIQKALSIDPKDGFSKCSAVKSRASRNWMDISWLQ